MEKQHLPIMLPEVAIKEFQDLMKKHFGLELTIDQAKRRAQEFMAFFMVISQVKNI